MRRLPPVVVRLAGLGREGGITSVAGLSTLPDTRLLEDEECGAEVGKTPLANSAPTLNGPECLLPLDPLVGFTAITGTTSLVGLDDVMDRVERLFVFAAFLSAAVALVAAVAAVVTRPVFVFTILLLNPHIISDRVHSEIGASSNEPHKQTPPIPG